MKQPFSAASHIGLWIGLALQSLPDHHPMEASLELGFPLMISAAIIAAYYMAEGSE
jgi:hypothetical protein